MGKEKMLQPDLFTGELVDTRSRRQKKRERERAQARQGELFSQREMAQFGVESRPRIPISPKTRIELALEDARSEEEKARDVQRQLEEQTYRLLADEDGGREQ